MIKVSIWNFSTLKREFKNFRTRENADKFFDKKFAKCKDRIVACGSGGDRFTYLNENGCKVYVEKMY